MLSGFITSMSHSISVPQLGHIFFSPLMAVSLLIQGRFKCAYCSEVNFR